MDRKFPGVNLPVVDEDPFGQASSSNDENFPGYPSKPLILHHANKIAVLNSISHNIKFIREPRKLLSWSHLDVVFQTACSQVSPEYIPRYLNPVVFVLDPLGPGGFSDLAPFKSGEERIHQDIWQSILDEESRHPAYWQPILDHVPLDPVDGWDSDYLTGVDFEDPTKSFPAAHDISAKTLPKHRLLRRIIETSPSFLQLKVQEVGFSEWFGGLERMLDELASITMQDIENKGEVKDMDQCIVFNPSASNAPRIIEIMEELAKLEYAVMKKDHGTVECWREQDQRFMVYMNVRTKIAREKARRVSDWKLEDGLQDLSLIPHQRMERKRQWRRHYATNRLDESFVSFNRDTDREPSSLFGKDEPLLSLEMFLEAELEEFGYR